MEVGSFNTKTSSNIDKTAYIRANLTASRNKEDMGINEAQTSGQKNETVGSLVSDNANGYTI